MSTDAFLSFEWVQGLPPAQVLHAALCAAAPTARLWFALEQDAASPQQMEAGVASAGVFVFLATKGALLKPNVRHEVTCAVVLGKRVLVLADVDGMPLEAVLAQGEGYVQADAAGDAAVGRQQLDAGALDAFKMLARNSLALPFHRDARLVSETAPALLAALGVPARAPWRAPPAYRMRALRPIPGHSDALLVASSAGAMQALCLAQACSAACKGRQLVLSVLPVGASAAEAAQAVGAAAVVVIVLTKGVWDCAGVRAAAEAAIASKSKVVLVHETEAEFGGQPFGGVMQSTPADLVPLFIGTAISYRRKRAEAEVMVGELVERLGGVKVAEPALPPPPLPGGYNAAPFAGVRAAVMAAVDSSPLPAAVIVGGLGGAGKTTLASSLALEEELVSKFDEVVWVTVGKVDHGGMVGVLHKLLDALEPPGAATATQSKDPLTSAVQRLRAVCARRAVLLVLDDLWKPQDAWAPDAAALLCAAVDVVPEDGGRASAALFTCRDVRVFESFGEGVRGRVRVDMGEIEPGAAAAYLAQAARLKGVPEMSALLTAVGRLPLSLTLAAACVRDVAQGMTEEEAVEAVVQLVRESGAVAGPVKPGAWLESAEFISALQAANEESSSAEYAPIYRALQAALAQTIARADWVKFAAFGLFEEDAYLPEGGLAALWGSSVEDAQALLHGLQGAGLVKWEAQAGRAVLHDLAHDFAVAIVRVGRGGVSGAAATAVDKCAGLLQEEGVAGVWWRREVGGLLRVAGKGTEGTELVWGLQWLIRGVRERGAGVLAREVGLQMDWERAQGEGRREEHRQLKLLQQMLVMAVGAFEGEEGPGNVAPHVIGRLGGLEGERIERLIGEAWAWDGGGRAWLRPVRPNFPQPGGACEGVLEGHTRMVTSVCGVGDGRIVSGSEDKTLRVWDTTTGVCVRVLEGHTDYVSSVCALEDGRIVSGSSDKTLRVWDAATGVCVRVLEGHTGSVYCVCALEDERIVSGSYDKMLRVWGAATGVCVQVLEGHTECVNSVCALEDGRIVSGSDDKTLRVWDAATGVCVRVLEGHTDSVYCVCALGDRRIVSGSSDKMLRLWDAATGVCLQMLEGHTNGVTSICVMRDGRIVSGSYDKMLKVWDAATGACVYLLEGHSEGLKSVCTLKNGRIVSGSEDNTLRVWDAAKNMCVGVVEGHLGGVGCVFFLEDGRIVSGSSDNTLRVWDAVTGVCVRVFEGHTDSVYCACALGDGRIVSGSLDTTLRVWDAATGVCLQVLEGHTECLAFVCALGYGRIVSGSYDLILRVWDAATGVCVRMLEGHTDLVNSVCALGDGRFVSGSDDTTLRVWDSATGECVRALTGHTDCVMCLCALVDGHIVSGSKDNTLRVWDASTGVCLQVLVGHTAKVISVCALSDGHFVSGSWDETLRMWDVTTGECLELCAEQSIRGSELAFLQSNANVLIARPHFGRTSSFFAPLGAQPLYLCGEASRCIFTTLPSCKRYVTVFMSSGAAHTLEFIQ